MYGTQTVINSMTPVEVADMLRMIVQEEVRAALGNAGPLVNLKLPDDDFMTIKQVTKVLGVSDVTLYKWAKDTPERKAILVPLKVGGRVRYRRQDVMNALQEKRRFKSDKNKG